MEGAGHFYGIFLSLSPLSLASTVVLLFVFFFKHEEKNYFLVCFLEGHLPRKLLSNVILITLKLKSCINLNYMNFRIYS